MSPSLALLRMKGPNSDDPILGDHFVLPKETSDRSLMIGRELNCDFRIDSLDVSRRHAMLQRKGEDWTVTDYESTNGLFINGQRLTPFTPQVLKIGDQISFGPNNRSKLIYKLVDNYCSLVTPKRKLSDVSDKEVAVKRFRNEWKQLFDLELSCSICHELFVSPVNLNCAHTFCESCIDQWKNFRNKRRDELKGQDNNCCPICRQEIVSQNRVLALESVIEFLVKKWKPSLMNHRIRLIRKRQSVAVA